VPARLRSSIGENPLADPKPGTHLKWRRNALRSTVLDRLTGPAPTPRHRWEQQQREAREAREAALRAEDEALKHASMQMARKEAARRQLKERQVELPATAQWKHSREEGRDPGLRRKPMEERSVVVTDARRLELSTGYGYMTAAVGLHKLIAAVLVFWSGA
jgi:hypothetical protein